MKRFVVLHKKIGETPLMAVEQWKRENPAYAKLSASYAGRLDPMASGKLIVLLGDECRRQKSYTGLDKQYEVEVLLDLKSDTGDVLGIVEYHKKNTHPNDAAIFAVLEDEIGTHERAYPTYSSKTVAGKPLFLHALSGTLKDISIPTHKEHIYKIGHVTSYQISSSALAQKISDLLDKAPRTSEPSKQLGENFRIDAIRTEWKSVFNSLEPRSFTILKVTVTCASGTYMRTLAECIGSALGTQALALSIRRTKIGKYVPLGRTGFWFHTY